MTNSVNIPNSVARQFSPDVLKWIKQYIVETINSHAENITGLSEGKADKATGEADHILLLGADGNYSDSGYGVENFRAVLDQKFGSSDNYSEFDQTTGAMKAIGSAIRWQMWKLEGHIVSSAPNISINSVEGSYSFEDTCGTTDYVVTSFLVPGNWSSSNTVFKFRILLFQGQSALPNMYIRYRWQIPGSAKSSTWLERVVATARYAWSAGSSVQMLECDLAIPDSGDVTTIVQLELLRDPSNASGLFSGADGVTGAIEIISISVAYNVDSIGSVDEYTKEGGE
jgi:hypothetical protein